MTGQKRKLTEITDMPLRHRLWWRFWWGWRRATIALVVMVALAWGTRPTQSVVQLPLKIRILEAVLKSPHNSAELRSSKSPVRKLLADLRRGKLSGSTGVDFSRAVTSKDYFLFVVARDSGEIGALGAFGCVWVFD